MSKVRICVELPEDAFRAFEEAAEREGLSVQSLLERTVNNLLGELERDRKDGTDSPILPR